MKRILAVATTMAMLLGLMTIGASAAPSTYMTGKGTAGNYHITEDMAGNDDRAGEVVTGNEVGTAEVDVKLSTTDNAATTHVYAVSYDVQELSFEYGFGGNRIWNPETLQYEYESNTSAWNAATGDITIYNYSDQGVKIGAEASGSTADGVTVAVYKKDDDTKAIKEITLDSAYMSQGTTSAATSGAFTVEVTGAPKTDYSGASIATITLTVSKVTEEP